MLINISDEWINPRNITHLMLDEDVSLVRVCFNSPDTVTDFEFDGNDFIAKGSKITSSYVLIEGDINEIAKLINDAIKENNIK